jgi:ATP synthase protein I
VDPPADPPIGDILPIDGASRACYEAARPPKMLSSRKHSSDSAAPLAATTRGYWRAMSATSVGLEMAVAVIIGIVFGSWLDGRLGTTPWMLILFLCFGFAAGMKGVFRYVRQADREAARAEAAAAAEARR